MNSDIQKIVMTLDLSLLTPEQHEWLHDLKRLANHQSIRMYIENKKMVHKEAV